MAGRVDRTRPPPQSGITRYVAHRARCFLGSLSVCWGGGGKGGGPVPRLSRGAPTGTESAPSHYYTGHHRPWDGLGGEVWGEEGEGEECVQRTIPGETQPKETRDKGGCEAKAQRQKTKRNMCAMS